MRIATEAGQAFADFQHNGLRKVFRRALADKALQIAQNSRSKVVMDGPELKAGSVHNFVGMLMAQHGHLVHS